MDTQETGSGSASKPSWEQDFVRRADELAKEYKAAGGKGLVFALVLVDEANVHIAFAGSPGYIADALDTACSGLMQVMANGVFGEIRHDLDPKKLN